MKYRLRSETLSGPQRSAPFLLDVYGSVMKIRRAHARSLEWKIHKLHVGIAIGTHINQCISIYIYIFISQRELCNPEREKQNRN